ncbi:hypothetical protein [Stakelama flava]|nr:hypothetical protein [Stakelama flava]
MIANLLLKRQLLEWFGAANAGALPTGGSYRHSCFWLLRVR